MNKAIRSKYVMGELTLGDILKSFLKDIFVIEVNGEVFSNFCLSSDEIDTPTLIPIEEDTTLDIWQDIHNDPDYSFLLTEKVKIEDGDKIKLGKIEIVFYPHPEPINFNNFLLK